MSIIVFLGVICGFALSMIAPEELKQGKRYFYVLYSIIYGLIISALLSNFGLLYSVLAFAIIAPIILKIKKKKFSYALMGAILYLAYTNDNLATVACLTFMLGFPLATIEAVPFAGEDRLTDSKKLLFIILKKYSWFLILAILPLLFSYL